MENLDNLFNEYLHIAMNLPALPNVVSKALDATEDPKISMSYLSDIVKNDQVISSKLLRMVNSAFFGLSKQINSISQALVLVGMEGLKSIIVAVSFKPFYKSSEALRLWDHSLYCATAAKIIAKDYDNVNPEELFIAGLMHDIGRLAFLSKYPEIYVDNGLTRVENDNTLYFEERNFGIDHCLLGYIILSYWNLPPLLCEATKLHHTPEELPQMQTLQILCLAELLANYLVNPQDNLEKYLNQSVMSNLGITEISKHQIDEIIAQARTLSSILS